MAESAPMVRVAEVSPHSNVVYVHVACDAHARRIITSTHRSRFHAHAIAGGTSRGCDYCAVELERVDAD